MVQSFSSEVPSQAHVACVDAAMQSVEATLRQSGLWLRLQKQLIPVMQHLQEWDIPEEQHGVFSVPQHLRHRDTTLIAPILPNGGDRYVDNSFASFTPTQFTNASAAYKNRGLDGMESHFGLHSAMRAMCAEGDSRRKIDTSIGGTALTSLSLGSPDYPSANVFARFNMRPLITLRHDVDEARNECLPIGPGSVVNALVQYAMVIQSPALFLQRQSEAVAVPEERRTHGVAIGALVAQELADRTGTAPAPDDQELIALHHQHVEAAQQQRAAYYPPHYTA